MGKKLQRTVLQHYTPWLQETRFTNVTAVYSRPRYIYYVGPYTFANLPASINVNKVAAQATKNVALMYNSIGQTCIEAEVDEKLN